MISRRLNSKVDSRLQPLNRASIKQTVFLYAIREVSEIYFARSLLVLRFIHHSLRSWLDLLAAINSIFNSKNLKENNDSECLP